MKKTCEFYSDNTRYTADILDAVPIPGDEYMGSGEAVDTVEEIYPIVPVDRTMNGAAYRLVTIDDNGTYERICFVPHNERMTVEEFIQNLMDNDEENIQHMTVEQAENILSWTRGDDEDDVIPEGLTAAELARRWNEIRGTADITRRYEAMEEGEDMGWCRCHHGTTKDGTECFVILHEGKVSAIKIGDSSNDYVTDRADVHKFASTVCPNYTDYSGCSDESIITITLDRCGCRACPWRDMCDAMTDI